MTALISVNGDLHPADRSAIPVLDHGFLYGDGVYETLRTYGGEPFLLRRHLERLEASCRMIRLEPPAAEAIAHEVRRALGEAGNEESYIRLMVTRGVGAIGYDQSPPKASLVVIVLPLKPIPEGEYERGVAIVVGRRRRNPVDSLDPAVKSCNLLNNRLAYMEAQDAGAHETILLNTRGSVAEGSHTNVFFAAAGVLRTPSLACGILSGITRELVLECARKERIPCEEGEYGREVLQGADEIFITSTLQEILPATRLDGRPVGAGVPGPLTRQLLAAFRRVARDGARGG